MIQQRKSLQMPLVGAILLGLCAGLILFAAAKKRVAKDDGASAVVQHHVDTPAADVLKYWTEDRMRSAKPAKMPKIKGPKRGKKQPKHPPV